MQERVPDSTQEHKPAVTLVEHFDMDGGPNMDVDDNSEESLPSPDVNDYGNLLLRSNRLHYIAKGTALLSLYRYYTSLRVHPLGFVCFPDYKDSASLSEDRWIHARVMSLQCSDGVLRYWTCSCGNERQIALRTLSIGSEFLPREGITTELLSHPSCRHER
jgi:hypothetical protein